MLLTSSQVSIAVSSVIVITFTTALFLSGYAIQQRTLRDLRAAIRQPPAPPPKIFLPDRFRHKTTELADGSVVVIDEADGGKILQQSRKEVAAVVVEVPIEEAVKPVKVEVQQEHQQRKGWVPWKSQQRTLRKEGRPENRAERRNRIKEEIKRLAEGDEPIYYQRRLH